ncbi:hypothetical protein MAHJHV61_00500 [Mycobacterium avium subsp. hominissuis]
MGDGKVWNVRMGDAYQGEPTEADWTSTVTSSCTSPHDRGGGPAPKPPARSGPAIRAVLAELAPDDLVEFEAEFRIALAETDDDFDLARVQAVIDKWWGRAYLRMHPPTEEERALVARVAAGDVSGLYTKTSDGQWKSH